MKAGMSLTEFATEVERQKQAKKDFKVPSSMLAMTQLPEPVSSPEGYKMRQAITLPGKGEFPIRRLMHQQLAERIGIPFKYYERMAAEDAPLLALNANYWLQKAPEVRLVRTMDGQARAYLGDRYRPLDNHDLFTAIAPVFLGPKAAGLGLRIESIMITEEKFYIKAFSTRITGEVKLGDIVQAGVTISNSEVGQGTLAVEPSTLRLLCYNGMIRNDASMKRRHVGRGSEGLEGIEEYLRDETREADDQAFWMKVLDVVNASFDEVHFAKHIEKLQAAEDDRIPKGGADLLEIREVVQKKYGFTETEGESILRNLIEGADLSRFGLAQAITLAAQSDDMTYQRSTELEKIGGVVIDLAQSEWKELIAA